MTANSAIVLLKIQGDSSGAVNATNQLAASLNRIGEQAQRVTQTIRIIEPKIKSSVGNSSKRLSFDGSKMFSALSRGIDTFRSQLMNTNDTIRLAAQGITNFGRSMMFFVSLPLIGLFTGMAKAATDFEDGLTRVRKTTGFTVEQITNLGESLRGLAVNTATSHSDLVEISGVLGQMANWEDLDTPVESLTKLTETISMFAVSTDQGGAVVASAMGKIANAFGWNLGESSESVERLANVINLLENKTAATAGEIMTTLQEFAPFATMLNMSAADATAFSAALVSVGLSASESGTALKNMGIYIARNAEEVAAVMGGYSDIYKDADTVLEAFGKDSVGVLLDILDAASKSEDQVASLLGLMEIADMRGGRGLAALSSNVDLLKTSLRQARSEWETHTSLLEEYNIAMTSTKSQVAVLKNNVADAGIIIGDALLPPLRAIMQVAVPAIRMLADAFKKLDKPVQMQVIALAGLVVVLGPVLMFLGQMVHAATLIVMGFGQALRVISFFVGSLAKLGPIIAAVGSSAFAWPIAIIGAIALVMKALDSFGYDMAGYFRSLATKAKTWGENLSKNIGSGLIGGAVRFVSAAISKIANMIASFFESHSPPKKGPLSTIDQWGITLMETFLNGFGAADFSILDNVSSIIERALTGGLEGEPLVAALRKLAGARVDISQLIAKFNQTGIIDEGLLTSATSGLGEMGDNVRDLIRLSLEYEKIQKQLAAIEERRHQILANYSAEIAAIGSSDKNITGKVDAIRAAKRNRDANLIQLDKEKDALEQQADMVKQQLDAQKSMIDALQDQEDIFLRIAELLKEIAEDKEDDDVEDPGGAGDLGGGGFGDIGDLDDLGGLGTLQDELDKASEKTKNLLDLFDRGKEKLQGFLDAWSGRGPKSFKLPGDSILGFTDKDMQSGYDTMYSLGQNARKVYDDMKPTLDGIAKLWADFKLSLSGDGESDAAAGEPPSFVQAFLAGITEAIRPEDLENFATGLQMLSDGFRDFMEALGYVDASGVGISLLDFLAKLAGNTVGQVISVIADLAGWFMYLWGAGFKLEAWLLTMPAHIKEFGEAFSAWIAPAKADWDAGMKYVQQASEDAWGSITELFSRSSEENFDILSNWLEDIGEDFSDAWRGMVDSLDRSLSNMGSSLTGWVTTTLGALSAKVEEFRNIASSWMQGLIDGITGKAGALIDTILGVVSNAVDGLNNFLGKGTDPTVPTSPTSPPKPKPGRWTGGPVSAGGSYVVGELGPELFSPNSNGSILSAHSLLSALGAAGASGAYTINITINNPTIRDDSDIRKLSDQVSAELVSRINRRTSFGGNIPI